jgi:hypothetical protein
VSITDFLFEGRPPASVTTYGSSTTNVPSWLNDYTQGLVARANTVAAEPYQQYGGPRIAGFTPLQQAAQNQAGSTAGAWKPGMNAAQGAFNSVASGPGALQQAQPFLNKAGGSYTDSVEQYMNPYTKNVIDRSTDLAQRALQEKLMPAINSNFIKAGTYGSAGQQRAVGRGLRDITEGVQSQANAALAGAYESGANIYNQDMSRQLQAGQTVGNLAASDAGNRLQAGQGLGALAEAQQRMNAGDITQLATAGKDQQNQNQRNLDLAYGDFQNQTNFDRNTTDWLSSIIRGIPYSSSTQTTDTGPAEVYGPSGLEQLGSIFSLWQGIQGQGKARGGSIKRLPAPRRGALEIYRSTRNGR